MDAVYKATCFAICLLLAACGNKGDLYLTELELTEEQKALLDELDGDKVKKKKDDASQSTQ